MRALRVLGSGARLLRGVLLPWAATAGARAMSAGTLPDHRRITMPKLSPTMEVGTIASWRKAEGDAIDENDVLAEIDTDKASMEYTYSDTGFLAKIVKPEGTSDVKVGELIGIYVEEEEDVAAFKDYDPEAEDSDVVDKSKELADVAAEPADQGGEAASSPAKQASAEASVDADASNVSTSRSSGDGGRIFATPAARKRAHEAGIPLAHIEGTGPDGRIVVADVQHAMESSDVADGGSGGPPSPAPAPASPVAVMEGEEDMYQDVEVSRFQKVTAARLLQSKQTIPHYYLSAEVTMDTLLALRAKQNAALAAAAAKGGPGGKVSVNDFVIKAAAAALRKVPEVNSQWNETSIRRFKNVDVSVAVQTERGLITPIVTDADRKGLGEISADVKALAAKAREGTLQPHEFIGGTFSVSNLGMFGVDSFAAIVNPPQAAILAVGASSPKVVPDGLGGYATTTVMSVTLSCDHRVVDGAVGARWLQAFKAHIEDPVSMIL